MQKVTKRIGERTKSSMKIRDMSEGFLQVRSKLKPEFGRGNRNSVANAMQSQVERARDWIEDEYTSTKNMNTMIRFE